MTVYLDMDGVLADFNNGILKYGTTHNWDKLKVPKEEWSEEDWAHERKVQEVMAMQNFFGGLPLMLDAKDLHSYFEGHKPVILTARPNNSKSATMVEYEKRRWIEHYFGKEQAKRFICCLGIEKQDHCRGKEDILIDDSERNISQWRNRSGVGIFHTSATSSIEQFEQLEF